MKPEHKLVLLLIVLSILLMCITVSAQQLESYSEQIKISNNGNADITWNFTLNNSQKEYLFPWNFESQSESSFNPTLYEVIKKSLIKCNNGSVNFFKRDGITFVRFKPDSTIASSSWQIKFSVCNFLTLISDETGEYGNLPVKYRYINTTFSQIKNFSSSLVLPNGYVIVTVDETIPKQTEDNPVSPFKLGKVGDQNSIVISSPKLKLGEHAFIKMNIRRDKKSSTVFIAFSIIGILYLFFFRDLTKKSNGNGNPDISKN